MRYLPALRIAAAVLPFLPLAVSAAPPNAGNQAPDKVLPFAVTKVAPFKEPWKIGVLPDGRMLITERAGALWLVTPQGAKLAVAGVPKVNYATQSGLFGAWPAPTFAADRTLYLTYAEPGDGGSGLTLARARLSADGRRLEGLSVLWRQLPKGDGGQFGAYVAFAPDGRSLFLSSGDRMRNQPAQDPAQTVGKILHLSLDGKPLGGALPGGKGAPEAWTMGHRNPYGLAFDAQGRLWETEMGPRGGDELNLIERGKDYGWPAVSYGINYDGTPIPSHDTRPEFRKPLIYWDPVIAPAGFTFYDGRLFPQWKGSGFVGGLRGETVVRIAFDGKGGAAPAERFDMGFRVRDVVEGKDGALWILRDGMDGGLLRLSPKG